MKPSFDNLLPNLAIEYNEKLINSFTPSKLNNDSFHRRHLRKLKRDRDRELSDIEDDISSIVNLYENEGGNADKIPRKKKKYDRQSQYFTDPITGKRSVMTYYHSVWYQTYVLNIRPDSDRWNSLFRKRFRMPYKSFLDLV